MYPIARIHFDSVLVPSPVMIDWTEKTESIAAAWAHGIQNSTGGSATNTFLWLSVDNRLRSLT